MVGALSGCGLGDDVNAGLGNPCELLNASDIQAATGQATENGNQGPENVCAWRTDGGGVFSLGIHGGGAGGFESAIRASGEGRQVGGVGERAFFAGNTQFAFLQVLSESKNVRLDYSGPNAPDEGKMTDLARKALEGL